MSEFDKLRDMATDAGIDADALLGELKASLLEDSREMLKGIVEQIAAQVEGKLSEFHENQQGQIERRVQAALEPVLKMAEEAKAKWESQTQAPAQPGSAQSNNSQGGPSWLGEGLGLLKVLIEQGDPVKQLTKIGQLREAFTAFEAPGPSPDTVFKIYADAAKMTAKGGGKGDGSRPLGRSGRSGSDGQPRGNPPKSLKDAIREAG